MVPELVIRVRQDRSSRNVHDHAATLLRDRLVHRRFDLVVLERDQVAVDDAAVPMVVDLLHATCSGREVEVPLVLTERLPGGAK